MKFRLCIITSLFYEYNLKIVFFILPVHGKMYFQTVIQWTMKVGELKHNSEIGVNSYLQVCSEFCLIHLSIGYPS